MRPCPRIAPTLPSIEVEVEAEAATRELGGAAPITRRATNQARAPWPTRPTANKARDGSIRNKRVDLRREGSGRFPARSVPVFPLRGLGGLVRWLCRAPVRRLAAARATEQELVYE